MQLQSCIIVLVFLPNLFFILEIYDLAYMYA